MKSLLRKRCSSLAGQGPSTGQPAALTQHQSQYSHWWGGANTCSPCSLLGLCILKSWRPRRDQNQLLLITFCLTTKEITPRKEAFSFLLASKHNFEELSNKAVASHGSKLTGKIVQGDPDLQQHHLACCNAPSDVCALHLPEQNEK